MDDIDYSGYRPLLQAIAYRMTGSVTDAEDIVQEALLRASGQTPEHPKAYLTTVTTRLAIDYLRSARVRRESYVGTWLPEPLLADDGPGPAERAEMADSLSMAFLVLLESLSPAERAVFLLREVFAYDYPEVAEATGKSEANARQLFSRARRRIDEGRPRFAASRHEGDELAGLFMDAVNGGDMTALVGKLAPDVVFYGDSGGKGEAAVGPLFGREQVVAFLTVLGTRAAQSGFRTRSARINGQPGIVYTDADGGLIGVAALDVLDGKVQAIRSVVNPDKLRHLGAISQVWHLRQQHPE
jgi:RNA polymerase sigma-70 factor (ECF subfamily)